MPEMKVDVMVTGPAAPERSRFKELTLVCVLAVVGIALTGVIIWFGWDVYEGLP